MFGGEKGQDLLPLIEAKVSKGEAVRPEHVEPDLILAAQTLIDLFWALDGWRKSTGMGPTRIDLADLEYYCKFYQFVIRSFEVVAIRMIDNVYLSYWKPESE